MILVDFKRSKEARWAEVCLGDKHDLFDLLYVLERSGDVTSFRVYISGVQVTDLHKDFGWGLFSKFNGSTKGGEA